MKTIRKIKIALILPLLAMVMSCEETLEAIPTDRFASDNISQSEAGITALLNSAYNFNNIGGGFKDNINQQEVSTDMGFNTGGGENRQLILFINFTWDAANGRINGMWNQQYFAIRDANIVIESIEAGSFDEDFAKLRKAEARYIRAFEYMELYSYFGPVPLRTSPTQEAELSRATDEEMKTFIETEFLAAIQDLPDPGQEELYGKANKGAALGALTRFYLNTKQWDKVLTSTQQLMNFNYYSLYPTYREMFFVENEGNREMVVIWPRINVQGSHNNYQNGAFPPQFKKADNIPEFEWIPGQMANWATQYRLRDGFVDSFDPADDRLQGIVQVYERQNGTITNLRAQTDNSRSLKFFDNNQMGNFSGSDIPVVRYADVLLSRAEALNEINGPTQASLDLVNAVRDRANAPVYTLGDLGGKDSFRDLILAERGWEFYSEGLRREDMIRHGKFISSAVSRGVSAQDYHVLFPIPEIETSANSNIEQNTGY